MKKTAVKKLFQTSALFVVLFGLVSFASIINPIPLQQDNALSLRSPASIAATVNPVTIAEAKHITESINFNCDKDLTKPLYVTAKTTQIRIHGKHCRVESLKFNTTKISNLTNQHQATVFDFEKRGFTSDFIQIDAGKNIIEIEESSNDGIKKVSQLIINKPASQPPL